MLNRPYVDVESRAFVTKILTAGFFVSGVLMAGVNAWGSVSLPITLVLAFCATFVVTIAVRQHVFMERIRANIEPLIVQQRMLITVFEDTQVLTRLTVVSQYRLEKRMERLHRAEQDLLKHFFDNRHEQFRMLMSPYLDALHALPDAHADIVLQYTPLFMNSDESSTQPPHPNLRIVQ